MSRYFGLSGLLHIALVVGLFYLGAKNDFSPHKVIESLSFESFGGEGGGEKAELKASTETVEAAPEAMPEVAPKIETLAAETIKPVKEERVEKSVQKAPLKANAPKSSPAQAKKSFVAPVQTFDNSNEPTPELEESVVEEAISEVKKTETQDPVSHQDETNHEEESQAIAAAHEQEIQKQNEAQAKADEEAARAKKVALLNDLRRQNAEREAQESAAAAASASSSGLGSKNQGEGPKEGEEVRAVSELKQIGGNPKPQYDNDDRMKNRSGTVVFQAFVQNDGTLKDFSMVESSGHRSLDSKTLKALRQWKFAAGQEGWIEIPFKWDLKGGAQEVSPLRGSRNAVTK